MNEDKKKDVGQNMGLFICLLIMGGVLPWITGLVIILNMIVREVARFLNG